MSEEQAQPKAPEAPPTAPTEELIDIKDFARIKFRVARIEAAEPVPNSQKLLKLALDLGEGGKRQIVAGIAKLYPVETLLGKKIIIVANLKPAKLMGIESQGMLLACGEKEPLALLTPDQDVPAGSSVR